MHARKSTVERNDDLASILGRLAFAIPVLALPAAIVHFVISRKFVRRGAA